MKKILFCMVAGLFFLAPSWVEAASSTFLYTGWLPFWKQETGAFDVAKNLDKLNSISPFSYEIRAGGRIVDKLSIDEGLWPNWLPAVRDMNIKVIPTIAWFDGPGIHKVLSKKSSRIAHEDAIAKLVKDKKFDGIDIDYESKLTDTIDYFSTFLYGLAIRLHPQKKLLVCTIEARMPMSSRYDVIPPGIKYANDYKALNKYCDEVRIMAYDQGLIDAKLNREKGSGTFYAPVADSAWVEKVIQEAIKTINPRKIMIGIPTYGYEYEIAWANGKLTYKRLRSHTFTQAMQRAKDVGASPMRNNAGELGFAYGTSTAVAGVSSNLTWVVSSTMPAFMANLTGINTVTRYVSFSDAESASRTIALAKKYNLRGAAFFKFDGDQDPSLWSVMQ